MAAGPIRAQTAQLSSDAFTAPHPQQMSELTMPAVFLCNIVNNVDMREA